jgi:hypothetical protein
MDYIAKNMNHHLMANIDVGRMTLLPHHHHHDINTFITVMTQIIIKLLLDALIFVDTLLNHNVTMRMTMEHMISWKVLALIEDPRGNAIITMLLKVTTTMTINNKSALAIITMLLKVTTTMKINNKSALAIINMFLKVTTTMTLMNKGVKVATIMTMKTMSIIILNAMKTMSIIILNAMKTMSVINTNIMNAKSVKEVNTVKKDCNVIINYILMTTVVILIMSKGANKVLKLTMALLWRMNLMSTTTHTMVMTT